MKEFKCEYYGHSMEMQNVGIKLEIWKLGMNIYTFKHYSLIKSNFTWLYQQIVN